MMGLVIIADDFGIGPETTRGILELGVRGIVTGSVLLVNSPFADEAVEAWRAAGAPFELGWHANLTLDRPVLQYERVASLIGVDGRFWPLATFMRRLALGLLEPAEIRAELTAQHERFCMLVGREPTLVNGHHHVHVFPAVGPILLNILRRQRELPYVRRVREPWSTLWHVSGSRGKRIFLSKLGGRMARRQERDGFPGNDWLAGNTEVFHRRLESISGRVVELVCHPGHLDTTLLGRDEALMQRRVTEWQLLADLDPARFGRQLLSPAEVCERGQYAV